jgi:hypothetical protein
LAQQQQHIELVWFKKDLRVEDHAALTTAAQHGAVLALWIYEDAVITAEDFDARHLGFANECLAELEQNLQAMGVQLLRRRGDAVQVLEELWQQTHFSRIHSHQETGNAITYQRDLAVIAWTKARNVEWQEFAQTGVVRRLKQRDGERLRRPTAEQLQQPDGILYRGRHGTGSECVEQGPGAGLGLGQPGQQPVESGGDVYGNERVRKLGWRHPKRSLEWRNKGHCWHWVGLGSRITD